MKFTVNGSINSNKSTSKNQSMKTKKNIISEEESKAVDNKSKGVSLGTRSKPKSLLEAIDNINAKLSAYVRDCDEDLHLSTARGNNVE